MQFSAWDFGGQEIFYPTHQFFLSDRAFYLVCFSLARPSVQRVEYWLKQIRAVRRQLPGPSVFLVGTHADRVEKAAASALLDRYTGMYKSYGVKGAFAVSCTEKTGIKARSFCANTHTHTHSSYAQ